jgi:hypothetical protein
MFDLSCASAMRDTKMSQRLACNNALAASDSILSQALPFTPICEVKSIVHVEGAHSPAYFQVNIADQHPQTFIV